MTHTNELDKDYLHTRLDEMIEGIETNNMALLMIAIGGDEPNVDLLVQNGSTQDVLAASMLAVAVELDNAQNRLQPGETTTAARYALLRHYLQGLQGIATERFGMQLEFQLSVAPVPHATTH